MLSALIFLPLVFALILVFIKNPSLCRKGAAFCSVAYFLFSLSLFLFFDSQTEELQLGERFSWFPALGIEYFVAVDGLSFWFVILTAFLLPVCVGASWNLIKEKVSAFYCCLFLMITSVMGTFLAMDTILFYIFFESSLIPLYFIIGIWGSKERIYAAFKFFIYTAFGSLFLLAGLVALMHLTLQSTGEMSASLLDFYKLELPFEASLLSTQNVLFFCFFLAFAIKLPFVPFHTWLPLAHVEAPAPGSAVLAAVILKMGAYGFLRFVLPLFPQSVEFFASSICFLAGVGIFYGALMALAQKNIKKLVAYSSVSHMAYVLLGLFSLNEYGLTGGYYQMLTHAVSSAGLFLLVGILYERTQSLNISDYGGLAKKMPILAINFVIISLSAIALPSTGGFISEFFVLMGSFTARNWGALFLALWGVIFGASYMLYLIHRVFFGSVSVLSQKTSLLSKREMGIILPFVFLVFGMGLFPKAFLKYSTVSLNHLQESRENYNLNIKTKNFRLGQKHFSLISDMSGTHNTRRQGGL
ncbi:MAG: NADH-quinone oxidoreductase subunit M [Bdellovibrionales bacterium]|nr:NADH-quinone oxidoreductase subunit M [Bdellovibrionales bacterium]